MSGKKYEVDAVRSMSPVEAAKTFSKDERELFASISTHIDKKQDDDHSWHYKLGQEMADIWRKTSDGPRVRRGQGPKKGKHRRYFVGKNFVLRMAIAKGFKSEDILMNALRVVETWPDPDEYQEFVDMRSESGYRLSWTHMVHLAPLSDPDERREMAEECLRKGWSTQQLVQHMSYSSGRESSNSGRPPRAPADLEDALTHIQAFSKQARNLVQKSWMGDRFDLNTAMANQVHVTPKLVSSLRSTETSLRNTLEQLGQVHGTLSSMLDQYQAKLEPAEQPLEKV